MDFESNRKSSFPSSFSVYFVDFCFLNFCYYAFFSYFFFYFALWEDSIGACGRRLYNRFCKQKGVIRS